MREILFKAKRIDNGEWIIGSLIQTPYLGNMRSWISSEQDDKARLRSISTYQAEWRAFEVKTDTICQYTGLTDKNGQKIWENDVVRGYLDDSYPEDATYAEVIWWRSGFYTREKGSNDVHKIDSYTEQNYEIVGNIFDNPELLSE